MSTNVFAYSLHKPNNEVFFWLLWAGSDELHVMHCAAHLDKATRVIGGEHSEQKPDRLEAA